MASASLGFRWILPSSLHLVQQAGNISRWPECFGELTDPRPNPGMIVALSASVHGQRCSTAAKLWTHIPCPCHAHAIPMSVTVSMLMPCLCPGRARSCSDQLSPAPGLCWGWARARDTLGCPLWMRCCCKGTWIGNSEPAPQCEPWYSILG